MEKNKRTTDFLSLFGTGLKGILSAMEDRSIPPSLAFHFLIRHLEGWANYKGYEWAGLPGNVLTGLKELDQAFQAAERNNLAENEPFRIDPELAKQISIYAGR